MKKMLLNWRRRLPCLLLLVLGLTIWKFWSAPWPEHSHSIQSQCLCVDPENQKRHDFCYHLPGNPRVLGQKFSCSLLPLAKNAGVLDENNLVHLENRVFPQPVFVTAVSDRFLSRAQRAISTLRRFNPNVSIIFYDLGLKEEQIRQLRQFCQFTYRKFPLEKYPPHVSFLREYRWKPLIIAETLKEFGSIWWMDSSVVWKKADLSHVYELVKCHRHQRQKLPPKSPVSGDKTKSGWDWREAVQRCEKSAYLLHGFSGHGIFSATHPHVYSFIPTNLTALTTENAKMYDAGFAFAVRTPDVVDSVLKWYVLCALEKECMGPSGAKLSCNFRGSHYSVYADCHRFDQSIINLLLANRYGFDYRLYTSGISGFFKIVRGIVKDYNPSPCPIS